MLNYIQKFTCDNQGSEDWLERTKCSIGGSSIAYFFGNNPYKKYPQYVKDRIIGKRFSNIAMDFGSLMEDAYRAYLEILLDTKIYVLDEVPFIVDDGVLRAHYSMDGLFEADISKLRGSHGEVIFDGVEIALLEIKFPWSRRVNSYVRTGQCKIPKMYKDQVAMGLQVIEPSTVGLFADCVARICSLNQMEDLLAYSPVHVKEKNDLDEVLAYGVVKIYTDLWNTSYFDALMEICKKRSGKDVFVLNIPRTIDYESCYKRYIEEIGPTEFEPPTMDPIDFGDDFKFILSALKNRTNFRLEHVVSFEPITSVEADEGLFGYIPWKLFKVYYGRIDKNPEFLDEKIDEIIETSKILYKARDLDEEARMDFLDTLFVT